MKLAVGFCLIVAVFGSLPAPAMANCQCRANGRSFEQGQVACLRLPNGAELARCGKELNNSSWKKVQDGCPSAEGAPAQQSSLPETTTALDRMLPPGHDHAGPERVSGYPL
jgi:hypothetical protein